MLDVKNLTMESVAGIVSPNRGTGIKAAMETEIKHEHADVAQELSCVEAGLRAKIMQCEERIIKAKNVWYMFQNDHITFQQAMNALGELDVKA